MKFATTILLICSLKSLIFTNGLDPLVTVRKGNIICNHCNYKIKKLQNFNFKNFKKNCSYQYIVRHKEYFNCQISARLLSYDYIDDVGDILDTYEISLGAIRKNVCTYDPNVYCELSNCNKMIHCCEESLCNDPSNFIINIPYLYKTISPRLNITDNYQRYTTKECELVDPSKDKVPCITADFNATTQSTNVACIQEQKSIGYLITVLMLLFTYLSDMQ